MHDKNTMIEPEYQANENAIETLPNKMSEDVNKLRSKLLHTSERFSVHRWNSKAGKKLHRFDVSTPLADGLNDLHKLCGAGEFVITFNDPTDVQDFFIAFDEFREPNSPAKAASFHAGDAISAPDVKQELLNSFNQLLDAKMATLAPPQPTLQGQPSGMNFREMAEMFRFFNEIKGPVAPVNSSNNNQTMEQLLARVIENSLSNQQQALATQAGGGARPEMDRMMELFFGVIKNQLMQKQASFADQINTFKEVKDMFFSEREDSKPSPFQGLIEKAPDLIDNFATMMREKNASKNGDMQKDIEIITQKMAEENQAMLKDAMMRLQQEHEQEKAQLAQHFNQQLHQHRQVISQLQKPSFNNVPSPNSTSVSEPFIEERQPLPSVNPSMNGSQETNTSMRKAMNIEEIKQKLNHAYDEELEELHRLVIPIAHMKASEVRQETLDDIANILLDMQDEALDAAIHSTVLVSNRRLAESAVNIFGFQPDTELVARLRQTYIDLQQEEPDDDLDEEEGDADGDQDWNEESPENKSVKILHPAEIIHSNNKELVHG